MTNLSPAAQTVLDAAADVYWDWCDMSPASSSTIAAAALQTVADQVVPAEAENEDLDPCNPDDKAEWAQYSQRQHTRSQLLAIAAELEAQP